MHNFIIICQTGDEKIKSEPKWYQNQKFHLGSNLNFSSSRNRSIANKCSLETSYQWVDVRRV